MSPAPSNRRAILAMITAMALFTANDSLTKVATASLPPGEIMAVRGVMAVLLMAAFVVATGQTRHMPAMASPRLVGRAALEAASVFAFLSALGHLQLANVSAIIQSTPVLITLLSVLLGIERVGWRGWSSIGVGFAGVLLIVKPSPSGFNVYAGLALASAVLIACRDLVTRSIAAHVPTTVVTLSNTIFVALLGFGLALREEWAVPSAADFARLAGAALFVTLGNFGVIHAFRLGDMSVVSPFRYTLILSSITVGFLVFGELPDSLSVLGIALIVASGLYALHREQVRQRLARAEAFAPSSEERPRPVARAS